MRLPIVLWGFVLRDWGPVELAAEGSVSSSCDSARSAGSFRHAVFRLARSRFARALDLCGQATKGAWGMSWHQEAMKGVEDCEKLGGVVKQAMIPRFPN
jgi:hypothetical protein